MVPPDSRGRAGERLGAVTTSPTAADGCEVRLLGPTDSAAGEQIAYRAFSDLSGRLGMQWPEPDEDERIRRGQARIRHIVDTDPEGAWGAFHGDDLVGVALAIRRGDLWGLSLLVVDPPHQSSGVGRRLLGSALSYYQDCRGGLILSSADPRPFAPTPPRDSPCIPSLTRAARWIAAASPPGPQGRRGTTRSRAGRRG